MVATLNCDSRIRELVGLAFEKGAACDANSLIADVRETMRFDHGDALNYEVLLDNQDWAYVEQTVAPRLALYLRSKRYQVSRCGPAFLSIFLGEQLYFVEASAFYEYVRQQMGLDEQRFARTAESWERSGRFTLAALPPLSESS